MKFSLGTAQLSNNYGVLKKKVKPKKIFNFINNDKTINLIDTAPAYCGAEKIIGKYLERKIKIITKISPFKYISTEKNLDKLKRDFENSLKNLKRDSIYGLLFHDEKNIKYLKNDKFYSYLVELQKYKLVEKIGFSSYQVDEIENYFHFFRFNIVQLPINIFNLNKKYINKLKFFKKKYNIEIHARSLFLQGLGLANQIQNKKFSKLNQKLNIIKKISSKYNIQKEDILISAVSRHRFIEKIIVGCSSINDLMILKKFKNKQINDKYFQKLIIRDQFITDPRKWPKKLKVF